jgi:hypothetical protein
MAPVIFYHYPCPDGIVAALAAHLHFRNGPAAPRFVPMTVFSKIPQRVELAQQLNADDTAYLVDYSGGVEFILALCAKAKRVVLLDHHKTAEEDIAKLTPVPENLETVFDMQRSGATIARDYFNVTETLARETPELAKHIADLFAYVEDVCRSRTFSFGCSFVLFASPRLGVSVCTATQRLSASIEWLTFSVCAGGSLATQIGAKQGIFCGICNRFQGARREQELRHFPTTLDLENFRNHSYRCRRECQA